MARQKNLKLAAEEEQTKKKLKKNKLRSSHKRIKLRFNN